MDVTHAYLPLTPENAKLFEQVNQYVPVEIFLGQVYAQSTFAIVIEDYKTGNYRFVNSSPKSTLIHNVHFQPNIQQPLKTIGDLHNLVKVFNGIGLTLRKVSRCCGRCDGVHEICIGDQFCEEHNTQGCEICFGER